MCWRLKCQEEWGSDKGIGSFVPVKIDPLPVRAGYLFHGAPVPMSEWLRLIDNDTRVSLFPPLLAQLGNGIGNYAGDQEVGKCCTRGEFEESIMQR